MLSTKRWWCKSLTNGTSACAFRQPLLSKGPLNHGCSKKNTCKTGMCHLCLIISPPLLFASAASGQFSHEITRYFTDLKDNDYCQASFIVKSQDIEHASPSKTFTASLFQETMVTGQAMSIFHQSFRSLLISLFQSKKLLYKIPHCFSNGWIRPPILPDWPLYEGSLAGLVWFHQTPGPVGLPGNLQARFHFPQKTREAAFVPAANVRSCWLK